MTLVRVYIATTEGPAEVQRITEEEPKVNSVICLDGKALALPISPDYELFVRSPTGIIEKAYGHSAYRMDVSSAISEGMSWQLGTLVAHALLVAGRLAQKSEQASLVVWLTGEVDRDLQILPVEYVREKIRNSGELLNQLKAARTQVILGMPRRNYDELNAEWFERLGIGGEDCRIVPLDTADQIFDLLGLPAPFAKGPQAASARALPLTGQTKPVIWILTSLVLLGLLFSSIFWWGYGLDPPTRDPPSEPAGRPNEAKGITQFSVSAIEMRAQRGSTCAAVNFGSAEAELTEFVLSNQRPVTTEGAEQLCGLRYRVWNRDGRAEVWVVAARSARGSSSLSARILAQARLLDRDESVLLDIPLPRRLEQPLLHRLAIVAVGFPSGGPGQPLDRFIAALDGPVLPAEWNRLLADLQKAGLGVTNLTHEIHP